MSSLVLEQQINLYQPILGAEKRLFSARAIAVALCVFAVCLVGLSGYGSRRTSRLEHAVDEIEKQEAVNLSMAAQAGAALRPALSQAELDARAKALSADIDARQLAVDVIRNSALDSKTGFAARLEALARRRLDGIWLGTIVLGSGDGRLSMRGAATDSVTVPRYLASLADEPALAGTRFDKLTMRRALPEEAPALVVFELDGPGLDPASADTAGPVHSP
jgi:hypothetical protein